MSQTFNPLIVIPTYNERENIAQIVPAVLDVAPEVNILVVDDSSPDGTGDVVSSMMEKEPESSSINPKE